MFQPYIKGGAAYIVKKQVVQIAGSTPYDVSPSPGWGPSYGVGAKLMVTDSLAIKASYDAVHTPVDDHTYADDITARAGVSWIF